MPPDPPSEKSDRPQGEGPPTGERLQKVLATAGFGSRRKCDQLIEQGRVTVNTQTAVLGQRVNPDRDQIAVDEVSISVRPDLVYYLLNKTKGTLTTAADTHGRPTVLDDLPPQPRVFSVGRLDKDTEGVLLLTNDGDLAHRLTHPSFGVPKSYLVQLDKSPAPAALRQLRQGVPLEDGPTAPAKASLVEPTVLRLVVHEGRNRLVRRMCEHLGYEVLRLVRHRFGPLTVGKLKPGQWRELKVAEVRALEQAVAGGAAPASGVDADPAADSPSDPAPAPDPVSEPPSAD